MRPHYKTVPRELWTRAKELRRESTQAELILWQAIRGGKLGVTFRRQHPFGPCILDFYSAEIGLVIELDGGVHDDPKVKSYDVVREEYLAQRERVVVRYSNEEVLKDLETVMEKLRRIIAELKTRPIPSP